MCFLFDLFLGPKNASDVEKPILVCDAIIFLKTRMTKRVHSCSFPFPKTENVILLSSKDLIKVEILG